MNRSVEALLAILAAALVLLLAGGAFSLSWFGRLPA